MVPKNSSSNSIRQIIDEVFNRHRSLNTGTLPDYIPELTRSNPNWFGIAITTVDGRQYLTGDTSIGFSVQSVSKPFVYGLALDANGLEAVRQRIDVEPSGEAFNSISLKPGTGQPRNPMINAGAIAATGMIAAGTLAERFEIIQSRFGDFAGRPLTLDESIYRSESSTGFRNRAIANLLRNFNIIQGDVDPILEAYFMQCSLLVDCAALSVMGATLANGGVNPMTSKRVLSPWVVEKVTSVMSTCGMYDYSGNWAFEVGIPAKSGVGGGIIGVLPGQLSVAVFSPLLDPNYNSVRGIAAFRDLSSAFGLHLLNRPSLTDYVIRRTYTLDAFHSNRFRPRAAQAVLEREGRRVRVFELQGDLYFGALERVIHAYAYTLDENDRVLIDLTRVGNIDEATRAIMFRFARQAFGQGKRIILVDPGQIFTAKERRSLVPMAFVYDDCNTALEDAEENLLAQSGARLPPGTRVDLAQMDLLQHLSAAALLDLRAYADLRAYPAGTRIVEQGSAPAEIHFLAEGLVGIAFRHKDSGEVKQVSSFSPGMSFGELSLLQGQARTADVVAITKAESFVVTREALTAFRRTNPEAYEQILLNTLQSLSERLVRANREVSALR